MNNFSSTKDCSEFYEIEIVHKNAEDGLIRPGMIRTMAMGLRDLDHVFEAIADKMPGSKVKVGRKIMFHCSACHALIGEKTIPLRLEQVSHMRASSPETTMEINTELHMCLGCGYHTKYAVQDPILSIY
jgi:hypothetical protein